MNEQLFLSGYNYYYEANKETKRKMLELKADYYMAFEKNYAEFQSFMEESFHSWMRSRNNKSLFLQSVNNGAYESVYNHISNAKNIEELNECLEELMGINGIGPVNASAIITLVRPKEYGVVSSYVINAINEFEKKNISYKITVHTVRQVEDIYIKLSDSMTFELNRVISPRDLDKAYWGLGWYINKKRKKVSI